MSLIQSCDILVLGGGPAGTLIASGLAKNGRIVVQLVSGNRNSNRPFEVLSPNTRDMLKLHGLPEPETGAAKCRGVLSIWANSTPEFYDYEFNNCTSGLAIDRNAFHECLAKNAMSSGVITYKTHVRSLRAFNEQDNGDIAFMIDRDSIIQTKYVVQATGRQFQSEYQKSSEVIQVNNQIALSVDVKTIKWGDCLIIEAVNDGWFYLPPMLHGHTQLVFLSEAALIPRDIFSRNNWLAKCFEETTYIKDIISERPLFTNWKGTDACFKWTKYPCKSNMAMIGDAALALDPLSGSGTWLALQSAEKLLNELLDGGMNVQSINSWHHKAFEDELKIYYSYYYETAKRFPNSMFWNERLRTIADIYKNIDP